MELEGNNMHGALLVLMILGSECNGRELFGIRSTPK